MTALNLLRNVQRSAGWLWVPPLAISFAFWPHLGPAFQPETFWQDIPAPLGMVENALRVLVIGVAFFMRIGMSRPRQRVGLTVYLGGLALYALCQVPISLDPASAWSTSAIGFLAPAYTPLIWLVGIGMMGDRLLVPRLPWSTRYYITLSAAFVAAHLGHAALVFIRGA